MTLVGTAKLNADKNIFPHGYLRSSGTEKLNANKNIILCPEEYWLN